MTDLLCDTGAQQRKQERAIKAVGAFDDRQVHDLVGFIGGLHLSSGGVDGDTGLGNVDACGHRADLKGQVGGTGLVELDVEVLDARGGETGGRGGDVIPSDGHIVDTILAAGVGLGGGFHTGGGIDDLDGGIRHRGAGCVDDGTNNVRVGRLAERYVRHGANDDREKQRK
ncbi:MAG: hypothetical protein NTY38_25150 [Acidobacteria bacterium]|nr:hypothetical protein [Acidobacteriota bacterium]